MLNCFIDEYLIYCKSLALSPNTLKELKRYVKHLDTYWQNNGPDKLTQVKYKHLIRFVISGNAARTTIKARIWAMKKFFCYLQLNGHIKDNPAKELSPPKIAKTETRFLTESELKIIFNCLAANSHNTNGLRDFIIILLMAICGLRKSSVVALDREDYDATGHTLSLQEKGLPGKRTIPIPSVICRLVTEFIERTDKQTGPLVMNRKKHRLKPDGVNKIVTTLKKHLLNQGHSFANILHPHIFRHSAATELNEVAGFTLTKEMLGHRNNQNTRKYIHLSPSSYGAYMKRHPYFGTARHNYFSTTQKEV
jgi:site-specific recombinase XerD